MNHPFISGFLLSFAVALVLVSSIGLVAMRDAFQRLHFSAPVVTLAAFCIVLALWLEEPDWQARIKGSLILVVLAVMNSVLCYATARALRIRQTHHWPAEPDEKIPVKGRRGVAGAPPFESRK